MSLVGERKAIVASVLIFFTLFFLLVALQGPSIAQRMFLALACVYGMSFFAVVANYFWGRWYAIGIGIFGFVLAAMSAFQEKGIDYPQMVLGGAHLAILLFMSGEAMAKAFEGKPEWRARLHMDENAVNRLGSSVIRAGFGLPVILVVAFAPKQPNGFALAAALLAAAGFSGLVRLRTWGVLALGGAAIATAAAAVATGALVLVPAAGMMAAAVVPFLKPLARALRA